MNGVGILYSAVFFILAIGVLVTFHEFGHYWVARLLNVKVLRFSVGFGKPLYTWRKTKGEDEIEYVIAILPLGGYVKMLDEREGDVEEKDKHRAFNRQPVLNRIAIVAAGPIFNFILAIFLYWIVFLNGVEGRRPILDQPVAESLAALAGFKIEDEIISVAETQVTTWQTFRLALIDHGLDGGDLKITIKTNAHAIVTRTLNIGDRNILDSKEDAVEQLGFKAWQPDLPAVIGGTTETGAAQQAGILKDDKVISIDGVFIENWRQLVQIVQSSANKNIEFLIDRNGIDKIITIKPASRNKNGETTGFIGAYQHVPEDIINRLKIKIEYGVFEAMQKAVEKTWSMSVLTLRVLGKMLIGEASLENISGPITIATYAGITASIGVVTYLSFLAIISVSLGVLNLLPIPMLDGGHLFYYIIEIIKGSPVSARVEIIGQQIGMALLFMLMSLAIFNDVQRLIN